MGGTHSVPQNSTGRPVSSKPERPRRNRYHKPDAADFPRSNYQDDLTIPPPYLDAQKKLECLYAAYQASRAWRKAIEDAGSMSSKPIEEIWAVVDDTCIGLAVLDKVWEWNQYERGFLKRSENSPKKYDYWLVLVDEWIDNVYQQACDKLPSTSTPPSLDWVREFVRSCMALLCTLRDVYNPPTIDYRRDFDLSKLGRFASRYFAYTTSELVEDPDAEDGYTTRMGVHTPEPWPPVNADNKSSEQSSGASCASLPQLQHDDQVKVKPLPMGEPSVEADPPVETGCATIAASDGTELSKVQSVAVQTRSVAVQTVISNPTFH